MVLWAFVYWHAMVVITSPIYVVTQQRIIYSINWLLATVLMPKLTHTPYLTQHKVSGLLLIGFVAVSISVSRVLALTKSFILVQYITETFNLQWQLLLLAKL